MRDPGNEVEHYLGSGFLYFATCFLVFSSVGILQNVLF